MKISGDGVRYFGQKSVLSPSYINHFTRLHLIADYPQNKSSLSGVSFASRPKLNMTIIWDIVTCSLVEIDRRFRGAYCLHHRGVACLKVLTIRLEKLRETTKTLFRSAGNPDYIRIHLKYKSGAMSLQGICRSGS
jgi:hypothetical protein